MKLVIEDDAGRKTVVPFAREKISIGRETGNTVRLPERNVSRRHAVLVREADAFVIEDLGSHNGVRVNGDRIKGRSRVNHGDVIQIGDYDLALEDESKTAAPERPTQPNLTPVPDHVGRAPRDQDVPFHRSIPPLPGAEAGARLQKAAAIQALLSKGDPTRSSPPGPPGSEQWPPDFHFVAPGTVEQMASQARRRRYLLGAVIGLVVILATVVAFGFLRPEATAPSGAANPRDAVVEPAAVAPASVPANVPASAPAVVAPAPAPAVVAPASVLANAPQKPAKPSTSETSRRKALDLYQDAVADVANGDYQDALGKLQASLELDPTSPAAQKEIAICYSHLQQPDKGAYHYEQYLRLRPDAPTRLTFERCCPTTRPRRARNSPLPALRGKGQGGGSTTSLPENHQDVPFSNRLALLAADLRDRPGHGRLERHLHLHRFEDHEHLAGRDHIADLLLDLPHRTRDVRRHRGRHAPL